MSEVAGIILNSILNNPDELLEVFPKLKLQYFNSSYSEIFTAITKYYNKFDTLPSFQLLEITIRNQKLLKKIKALSLLEVDEDIDIYVAVEALVDQFTQDYILDEIYTYVDKITHYDSSESILKLSDIVMHVEEVVDPSDEDFLQNDLFLMDKEELLARVPFTLNNTLDATTGGIELTNLVMIGGHRGAGKSVVGCNIATNHYSRGGITMFFTIEMRAREINQRMISILSGVSNKNIKNQTCTPKELQALAETRAGFFMDSTEVYEDYLVHKDYGKFERNLISTKVLKPDNQIIIIDNPTLTLSDIDSKIQKYKTKHGDRLQTVIVDSMNKIVTTDKYDWKHQIETADKLKDYAAKHDIVLISSYQTDKGGEARFAKGILDSGDCAINLTNNGKYLNLKSTKTRGMPSFEFNSEVEWDILRMGKEDYVVIEDGESEDESKESNNTRSTESARDTPWR